MNIADALDIAEKALAGAGIDTARADVEWIAARALKCRRSDVLARADGSFPEESMTRFDKMVVRRAGREPLAYIVGSVGFRGLELEVGAGCLVPRPETEITAGRAIARAREKVGRATVVDIGSGSGAIALSIAAEVPDARIFATESSAAARGWTLRNLARTGLRCTLLPGDLLTPLHPALGGGVDVVVSNPPYVSEDEWDLLEPEVRRYEPREAVVGGPTGYEIIHDISEHARTWLAHGAWIVLEVAPAQTSSVCNLLEYLGYSNASVTPDLAGRERVVEARWLNP